jgi:uncharacterized protein (TIGR02271 family)
MGAANDMIGTDTLDRVIGADVYDESGNKIGSASEVYLDDESGQPEWVTVRTGLFGTKESFVPIRDADLTEDGVHVHVAKDKVKDAPKIDTDGHLSPQEEEELYRYYGLGAGLGAGTGMGTGMAGETTRTTDYESTTTTTGTTDMSTTGRAGQGYAEADMSAADTPGTGLRDRDRTGTDMTRSDTAGAETRTADMAGTDMAGTGYRDTDTGTVGRDVSGPTTDDAMTRSEERLNVGTRSEEVGRARLRKYVVSENVTETVPVSREEVRVEREPITDANVGAAMDGPAISEEEHEVTLRAERPVVEKEAVPVERVRLDKETVTDEAQVNEEVRKEQIDVDGADGDRRI